MLETLLPRCYQLEPGSNKHCKQRGASRPRPTNLAFQPKQAETKTIHEKASRIMARGKVRARIAELMAPVIAKAQMSRTEWLEWRTKCCRFDLRKMFDATGKLKNITELDENERAAVAGFEFYEHFEGKGESRKVVGRTSKLKFMDRHSALAPLGKACHYDADRQEQPGRRAKGSL